MLKVQGKYWPVNSSKSGTFIVRVIASVLLFYLSGRYSFNFLIKISISFFVIEGAAFLIAII